MNTKAIVVYIDNNKTNFEEFSWLYKSWILWDLYEEYDIVAYANPNAIEGMYKYVEKHDNLIVRPLTPIYEIDSFWEDYKFANSFFMFNDNSESEWIQSNYEYILKSDADVFLTKNMKGLIPDKTMIGFGGYMIEGYEDVKKNIERLFLELKIKDKGINHVGASIFGKSKIVIPIVRDHFNVTKIILQKEWNNGPGKWPGWFKGVSSMYAIHLVVNHYLNPMNVNMYSIDSLCLDNKITKSTYHIHAWHVNQDFSKHKWFLGNYTPVKYNSIPEIAKDYCLWIASNDINSLKNTLVNNV